MSYIRAVNLFTDGGCLGNPGPGALGFVILSDANAELSSYAECIGHCTNNQAEYQAVIKGLDICSKYTRGRVVCFTDSELIVKQMNGVYRLINDDLRALFHKVKDAERVFDEVVYQHVKRNNQYVKKAHILLHNALNGR